jgi:hypothetical protein
MTPARYGWESLFPQFETTQPKIIRGSLQKFITDASEQQVRAWDDTIPKLQTEAREVLAYDPKARDYTAILEYELPMESRRPDVVVLANGAIVVLELKGKQIPSQADIDQSSAYARDLRCYHRECADRPVHAVVVPTRATGYRGQELGVHIIGPDALDDFIRRKAEESTAAPTPPDAFLSADAYRPLPSLVKAARELFHSGTVRTIHRARAATDPAVNEISRIIHQAAATRSRHLILLTGVPGAGKTLVGLRAVHAHFLDDLAVPRAEGKPTTPAVFLSGNHPLVEVLQYELRLAGGDGKTFVRHVKDYVKRYSSNRGPIPPEHVLVFDEAQRAFDADRLSEVHKDIRQLTRGKTEPAYFIEFSERIPEWCAVIGLIGSGQEIHVGEEAGLVQWRHALEGAQDHGRWQVHGPGETAEFFSGAKVQFIESSQLSLNTEIRFHLVTDLHRYVAQLLDGAPADQNRELAARLESQGYHLRITRDLETARDYLCERYDGNKDARFGIIASSKDKHLLNFGVPNDFQSTKRVKYGPWYSDNEDASPYSCRHLKDVITEFGAQGLELDAALLAWGTDFRWFDGRWSNSMARGYRDKVKDPFQLRKNAYRVLLTRGRDITAVFVPPLPEMNDTFNHLSASGFRPLRP